MISLLLLLFPFSVLSQECIPTYHTESYLSTTYPITMSLTNKLWIATCDMLDSNNSSVWNYLSCLETSIVDGHFYSELYVKEGNRYSYYGNMSLYSYNDGSSISQCAIQSNIIDGNSTYRSNYFILFQEQEPDRIIMSYKQSLPSYEEITDVSIGLDGNYFTSYLEVFDSNSDVIAGISCRWNEVGNYPSHQCKYQ